MSLTDALDDLISEGRIAPQLAMKILSNFDRTITEVLAERVKANLTFKVGFMALEGCGDEGAKQCLRTQGHLDTYRFCDEVWTFLIKDVTFKFQQGQNPSVTAEKVKIVSCNSKRPGEQ